MQSKPYQLSMTYDKPIQKWLAERQKWIVLFYHLCQQRPFNKALVNSEVKELCQAFCQLLMDYLSLGHFEMYEQAVTTIEQCQSPLVKIPAYLLTSLLQTTFVALDFNDKYQKQQDFSELDQDLSHLAVHIAQRLEWEDKLIAQFTLAKAFSNVACNS